MNKPKKGDIVLFFHTQNDNMLKILHPDELNPNCNFAKGVILGIGTITAEMEGRDKLIIPIAEVKCIKCGCKNYQHLGNSLHLEKKN